MKEQTFYVGNGASHSAETPSTTVFHGFRDTGDTLVQVIPGKAGDNAQGVSIADLCVLQDQIRASFDSMHDLKERLDKSDLQTARYCLFLCCQDCASGTFSCSKSEMSCRTLHSAVQQSLPDTSLTPSGLFDIVLLMLCEHKLQYRQEHHWHQSTHLCGLKQACCMACTIRARHT